MITDEQLAADFEYVELSKVHGDSIVVPVMACSAYVDEVRRLRELLRRAEDFLNKGPQDGTGHMLWRDIRAALAAEAPHMETHQSLRGRDEGGHAMSEQGKVVGYFTLRKSDGYVPHDANSYLWDSLLGQVRRTQASEEGWPLSLSQQIWDLHVGTIPGPEATLREVREFVRLVKDKCDDYLCEPYLDDLAEALLAKLEGRQNK